jgi:hypothetical protein
MFSYSQQLQTETVIQLEVGLIETSGLFFLNGKIITHNDSGSDPKLYEIDTLTGDISRTVVVGNATNIDWEDVCTDTDYIYIGDFGNNAGARTDLKLYKILISDFNSTLNDTVIAEVINFNFGNQVSFTPSLYTTNFDVEALISFEDSLYVFTKNWGNSETSYYAISKSPGSYSVNPKGTIDSQGMITGGVYNDLANEILLCGYTFSQPFTIRISQFLTDDFENGIIDKYNLNVGSSSIQIEGVYNFSEEGYYLSSESHSSGNSELLRLTKANDLGAKYNETNNIILYPNPTTDILYVNSTKIVLIEIYNVLNQLVMVTDDKEIDVSSLKTGVYVLHILEAKNKNTFQKIILE